MWGGGRFIDPRFFNLSTIWRWIVSFTLRSLHPRYPLERRLSGSQGRPGWRTENSWRYRNSNSDLLAVPTVASRYTDCATAALKLSLCFNYVIKHSAIKAHGEWRLSSTILGSGRRRVLNTPRHMQPVQLSFFRNSRLPAEVRDFPLLHSVEPRSVANPAPNSYRWIFPCG
jgi:hypothetical protein